MKQGMYMEIFSKVYYDRVYFLRAERFMTGSGFQPPSGTPRPFESRVLQNYIADSAIDFRNDY